MGTADRSGRHDRAVGECPDLLAAADRILVPVLDESATADVLPTVLALASASDAELVFVDLDAAREQTPYTIDDRVVATTSRPAVRLVQTCTAIDPSATAWSAIQQGTTAADTVANAAEEFAAITVFLAVTPDDWPVAERVSARTDCDTITATVTHGGEPASMLVVRTAETTAGKVDSVAKAVASARGATLDRVAVDSQRDVSSVIERTHEYDVTVLGASRCGRLWQRVFGSLEQTLRESAESDVLTVRPRTQRPSVLRRLLGTA